jgi:hypothetical protein
MLIMNRKEDISRRIFLKEAGKTAAGAVLGAGGISALGKNKAYGGSRDDDLEKYDFIFPRVKFSAEEGPEDYWAVYPEGDINLLRIFRSVVRCKVKLATDCRGQDGLECQFNTVVEFSDIATLRKYPFIFMTSQYRYTVSRAEKQNLRGYIEGGGFLFMDDCVVQNRGDFFYQSSYKLLEEVFGKEAVKPIPTWHEVFHNVYNFGEGGLPHCHGTYHPAQGVFINDRLAVFLSSTDIHCAWVGNHRLLKEGIQMGINILMYALSH